MNVLKRGYSVTLDAGGSVISDSAAVKSGDRVSLILRKGRLECSVDEVKK